MNKTKRLTALAMLISMGFLVGATLRLRYIFAAAPFLTYDPKDVVILIGGFMFGPIAALTMSIVLALLEMATVSVSGFIGALMNAISSASLTVPAALIYSKKRNLQGAVLGLIVGCVTVTISMTLWNYLIIPLYVPNVDRAAAAALLLPAIVPFNLIKAALNAAIALLLYKKVSAALRASGLYKEAFENTTEADTAETPEKIKSSRRFNIAISAVAVVIAIALIVTLFVIRAGYSPTPIPRS